MRTRRDGRGSDPQSSREAERAEQRAARCPDERPRSHRARPGGAERRDHRGGTRLQRGRRHRGLPGPHAGRRAGSDRALHASRSSHDPSGRILPEPVIAAVNGLAFGGGCELVEATHIAIAAATATFSKAEINIGIIPTFGGTQRLPRNVGRKAATELILSGRVFEASEAARLGLVNRVVSGDELLGTALRLAAELAGKPPLTLAAALSAIHRGMDAAIDDGLAIEEAAFARIVPTHDAQEGIAAFVEKRRPVFLGH